MARRANLPMRLERLHPGNKPQIPSGGRRVVLELAPLEILPEGLGAEAEPCEPQ